MTTVANILQYLSPVLVMAVAVVLFCVYLLVKRKRSSLNASIPTIQDGNTSLGIRTVSSRGGHAEEHQGCDGFPPRYSTVDHPPPPYSLFDPKQMSMRPGVPPPSYEIYPALPPAPYSWPAASDPADNPTTLN